MRRLARLRLRPKTTIPKTQTKDIDLTKIQSLFQGFHEASTPDKDSSSPWRVGKAETDGSLEVDAKGVKFQATASMSAFGGAPEPEPKSIPRRFWFDRPFFLFLWRDAAEWPYAGVWLGSAEALVK